MKTTVRELDYDKVMALPQYPICIPLSPASSGVPSSGDSPPWDWPEPGSVTPARAWRRWAGTSRA